VLSISSTPKAAIKFSVKKADLYARPGLSLSVEFFPAKTDKGEENLFSSGEIAGMKRANAAFSVTCGRGGSARKKRDQFRQALHKKIVSAFFSALSAPLW
jgi:hypothetical protein